MGRAKLIAALVLAAVAGVVVLQNTEPVETRFLFMTVTLPRAALLGITLLIGVAVGILVALVITGRKTRRS